MRRKSATGLLREEQDEDVMAAFEGLLRRYGHTRRRGELYAEVAGMRAPRWYVSRPRAMAVLYRMEKATPPHGGDAPSVGRAVMWRALRAAVKARQAADGLTLREACRRVLVEEAPSFFLTAGVIRNIVSKRRRGER